MAKDPVRFSQALADTICTRILEGETLRVICVDDGMPHRATIFAWAERFPAFGDQYARAQAAAAHALIEESREIVDDGRNDWMEKHDKDGHSIGWQLNGEHVQRSKLRADQRRWEASKRLPKVYGDKQFVEHSGSITLAEATDEELVAEILELISTGKLKLPEGVELVLEPTDEELYAEFL